MEGNPSASDPKNIWQNQPRETTKLSLVLLHRLAKQSRTKTRRELIGIACVQAAFAIFAVVGIVQGYGWQRVWNGAALLWCVAGAWAYQRGMWGPPLAGDAGLETGIVFLRRDVRRRRELSRRWLMWALGPIIFTLAAAVVPFIWYFANTNPKMLRNAIPFFLMFAGWLIGMVAQRIRKERELQREMDELNELGDEND